MFEDEPKKEPLCIISQHTDLMFAQKKLKNLSEETTKKIEALYEENNKKKLEIWEGIVEILNNKGIKASMGDGLSLDNGVINREIDGADYEQ